MKIRNPEDFWSGVLFAAVGAFAIFIARDYPLGSAVRMGPGYFPTAIGLCLIAIGLVITLMSVRTQGMPLGRWPWRAMLMMTVAFIIFAWGMENIGFVPSLALLVVVASLASPYFRWKEVAIQAVVMVFGAWVIFIYLLELPLTLWGRG